MSEYRENHSIRVVSIARDYAEVEGELIVNDTSTTLTTVSTSFNKKGLSADIWRVKKAKEGKAKKINEVNFTHMPPDCGVIMHIPAAKVKELYKFLGERISLREEAGIISGTHDYIVGPADRTIIADNTNIASSLKELLANGVASVEMLFKAEPELFEQIDTIHTLFKNRQSINEFESALIEERFNESYWQKLFEREPWMLQAIFAGPFIYLNGDVYLGGHKAEKRSGKGGVATDFLLADSSSKSLGVVEIKTPGTDLCGKNYRGTKKDDNGSVSEYENIIYSASTDFSGSIVQLQQQVATAIKHFGTCLKETYDVLDFEYQVSTIPVLIIGDTKGLDEERQKSFNHMRRSIKGASIITFDELLERLKIIYFNESA